MPVKSLNTLMRLHRRQIDMLRRSMAEMEQKKLSLEELIEKLGRQLAEEAALAASQPEMGPYFTPYAIRMRKRQNQMHEQITLLEEQMEHLREQIAAEFSELKKFELVRNQRLDALRQEAERKETLQLDEIGLQQHRRKEGG